MKDVAHHQKHLQKKVLQSVRAEESKAPKSETTEVIEQDQESEKLKASRLNPEYEGKIYDPHHRKPRTFAKRNYH